MWSRGRLWGLAVFCLIAALALSACGGGDDTTSGGGGDTEATEATTGGGEGGAGGEEEAGGEEASAEIPPFESVELEAAKSHPEPEKGNFKIAYMNPSPGNDFLKTLGDATKLEVEKLGGSYTEVTAKEPNEQVTQMEQLLAQGVEGIAVFALDPKALAPVVEKAKKQGVKLVTIDFNLQENGLKGLAGYESQVLQRRDYAAYLTAKYMAEHLEPGAELGTIEFAIKVPSIVFSIERDIYWAEKMGLKHVGSAANKTDDIAGGEPAMTELLNQHPDIKGVMAYNDPSAIGAYSAARSAGVTDIVFGGENGGSEAVTAIEGGRQTFSVLLDVPSMGKGFAWGLYDLLQGRKVPPTVIAGEPILLDKENVAEVPTWDEVLEEEYGRSE